MRPAPLALAIAAAVVTLCHPNVVDATVARVQEADGELRAELVIDDVPYSALRRRGVERLRVQLTDELAKAAGVARGRVVVLGVRAPPAELPSLLARGAAALRHASSGTAKRTAQALAGVKIDFDVLAGSVDEPTGEVAMKGIRRQLADAHSTLHGGPLGWLLDGARLVCCNAALAVEDARSSIPTRATLGEYTESGVSDEGVLRVLRSVSAFSILERAIGFGGIVGILLVCPVFMTVVGLLWFRCFSEKRRALMYGRKLHGFSGGLFQFQEPRLCACAFLCPHIRWASTVEMRGLITFSVALCAFVMLLWLSAATAGLALMALAVVGANFRRQIRDQDGITQDWWTTDLLVWLFCPCCAIAQEAYHVEAAGTIKR